MVAVRKGPTTPLGNAPDNALSQRMRSRQGLQQLWQQWRSGKALQRPLATPLTTPLGCQLLLCFCYGHVLVLALELVLGNALEPWVV